MNASQESPQSNFKQRMNAGRYTEDNLKDPAGYVSEGANQRSQNISPVSLDPAN